MKINKNWRIDKDNTHGVVLIYSESRKRKNKDTGLDTDYDFEDIFYYPNVKTALVAYLNKSLEEATEIKDILTEIERVENEISNLKISL